ncbi:hypothetical protein NLI96_g8200 [Meripilus lineatus]|uniref:HD/PDEase domain-containing protein n=1 Tax=Meripilus lineatus TaxID=2056292 RepID=A0AAD5UZZ6_9APHY|nr:hypothetical protein NLI96_g8200 [Physisporinus lineatus]
MYPTQEERIAIQAAERLMEETMARYDPSHDKYHVQRVRKTALTIARSVGPPSSSESTPDLLVIELAALLHDVLDKKYISQSEYSDPYAYFTPFFVSVAEQGGPDLVGDGRAREIVRIIENVSWSTEKKLIEEGRVGEWHRGCVELHCVQDADRLDAIGALGLSSLFYRHLWRVTPRSE